jgi:hypothetical protein
MEHMSCRGEGSLAVEWGLEKPHQRQSCKGMKKPKNSADSALRMCAGNDFGAFRLKAILRNQAAARSAGTQYGTTT